MRPRVRTNTLTGYAELARSAGLDPAAMMAAVGLDIADLDVPDRWLPGAPVARLLERSAEQANCPDFGLRLSAFRHLGTLGPISVVLRDEPDLRSALALLIRYERAYNEALHLRLEEDGDRATLEVWLEFEDPAPRDQALDLLMAASVGVLRALLRSDWEPLSASFARPAPLDARAWQRLFGPGVRFDHGFTGLVLAARDLAAPIASSDASVRPYTRQFLRTLVVPRAPAAATGVAEVVEVVEHLLPLGGQSIVEVSRELGVRPRVLQRYLAEHGETFSSIVHVTRARLAERYLPNPRYSLTDVSQLLGFGAPSAFSRWFRQHFGISATEWRRTARDGSRTAAAVPAAGEGQDGGD